MSSIFLSFRAGLVVNGRGSKGDNADHRLSHSTHEQSLGLLLQKYAITGSPESLLCLLTLLVDAVLSALSRTSTSASVSCTVASLLPAAGLCLLAKSCRTSHHAELMTAGTSGRRMSAAGRCGEAAPAPEPGTVLRAADGCIAEAG